MTVRRRIPFYALALGLQAAVALATVVIPRPASAHEFTIESLMNAFVKIEQREAHFVVRVPLHVLKSARFPVRGSEIDLTNADVAIQRALAQLGHEITIWETDRPLIPSGAIGRLTLPSDRSFERYQDAVAHVAHPVTPGTANCMGILPSPSRTLLTSSLPRYRPMNPPRLRFRHPLMA